MQRTSFGSMACSIARSLEAAGEPWSPLIIRDVFVGITRFDDLRTDLGISRKVLADRLTNLVEHDILVREQYSTRPPRHEYMLTPKGMEFCEVVFAMMAWGDRWTAGPAGPPVLLRHAACGEVSQAVVTCSCCGKRLSGSDVLPEKGPGGRLGPGTGMLGAKLAR